MKTGVFKMIIFGVVERELKRDTIPLARIAKFAKAALKLLEQYPQELPEVIFPKFAKDYLEFTISSAPLAKKASHDTRAKKIQVLRKRIAAMS